ncbi:MAG: DUF1553 domain-containing protein [Saprospiraceae bacterium]|nr:DUF1553 domain-containing protein [Saprospiraceae bacterium]
MNLKDPQIKVLPVIGLIFLSFVLFHNCSSDETGGELPKIVDFNYHIKPLLSDRCFACHGPDEKAREAKLSLHTEEGAFAALDSIADRFIIAPGDLSASEVYHRITSDDPEYMMPPPESNLSLSEYDIQLISKWIKQGAVWKKHWAFIPPVKPEKPPIKDTEWSKNPIDAFVWQKMRDHRLKPSSEERPEAWLRRVSFDLTGLPPDLETVDSFMQDHDEEDYEKIVDQLLASPAYGERMASIWLDLSRYADSHGYQDDKPRSIWPWRDWVINAFNNNLPYNQFVTEQLAGDLLPEPSYDQKLATAFNRNHAITQEGGVIDEEYRTEYAADRVQTFATSFLGITLQCARCHDHKYDPIAQKEFYELFSFFNSVEGEKGQISYFDLAPAPNIAMQDEDYENYIVDVKASISRLEDQIEVVEENEQKQFAEWSNHESFFSTIDIQSGLVADYDLDDSGWQFKDNFTQQANARANLNLPPDIERPIKIRVHQDQGLRFNGDNFVTLGEIGDFEFWNSFSVSLWFKHQGAVEKDAAIFGRRNEEQYRQGYDCLLSKSRQVIFRSIHNLNGEQIEVRTRGRLPSADWQHLAVTYDGSGLASGVGIYINGVRQSLNVVKDDLQGLSITNGNDFLIGHWNHRARIVNDQYGFRNGEIDQVKIYGKQLTGLEIKTLAQFNENEIRSSSSDQLFSHYLLRSSSQFIPLKNTLDSLRSIDTRIPNIMTMKERDTLIPAFVLDRGIYDAKLEPVERNTPEAILAFNQPEKNRLGLAKWLFDESNPLTARVAINRIWQQCFGNGFIKSAEDFGNQGDMPTHPELLDWLAVEFREKGWDIKMLLKKIVLSKTYRQSAKITENKLRVDSENKWLSRGTSRPLTAEMIRDQALTTSNLLYEKIGGKWVKPYQPGGIWKELANQIGENKYRVSIGRDKYRRSLYTYFKRTIPPPTMLTLDAPERSVCTIKRQATSTPLQALILLNDPTYLEASRHSAFDLVNHYPDSPKRIETAFLKIVNRKPNSEELDDLVTFFENSLSDLQTNPEEIRSLLNIGDSPSQVFANDAEGAALAFTISLIYNLDEAKYR